MINILFNNYNYKKLIIFLIFLLVAFLWNDSSLFKSNLNAKRIIKTSTWFFTPDSGKNSDSSFIVLQDSVSLDSLSALDTLKIDSLAIDSTSRLKQFRYVRKDAPFTKFNQQRKKSFFAYPSSTVLKRDVKLDSTGMYVIIEEKIGDFVLGYPLKIHIDEYVELKRKSVDKKIWEDLGYAYELQASEKDFAQLISDITNIQIPLPSTSFLSIFGPPRINLRINGAVDIHGAWRNETTEGISSSKLGNTRNEPDFKQQVQINVKGTIGDKLDISADWNTERTFEYENQLKLKYTGYEDEIIQSIEAGNVSLQTSSLVGGSEALFGIKAQMQMGPFSLTALASQKKGEVQEVSVSGGSKSQTYEIRAYEYSENHFFVDTIYASRQFNLFNNYYGNLTPQINSQFQIKELEVWKTIAVSGEQNNERQGNAFIDLPPRTANATYDESLRQLTQNNVQGQNVVGGRFVQMIEGVDYTFNPYVGVVSFRSQVQTTENIAVAYRVENGPGPEDDEFYGDFLADIGVNADSNQTILLKLIKPQNLQPPSQNSNFETAWKLQLKNIYPIGGRDIKKEGFVLDIKYALDGQDPVSELEGVKLLNAFGLDITDQSGQNLQPDGEFDFRGEITILPQTGEIIFPTLEPFGADLPDGIDNSFRYDAIYTETKTIAKQDKTKDKFLIGGEYSASVSSVYQIGFNVVENSVKVLLNGQELREGSDYSVDYNIGQVTLRNDAALVPGADLKITYEQNDLFALASKTLLGFRGLYEVNDETKLGFSLLNLNQQTLSDKVRIGEEPLNNTIFGADFQTSIEMPFITKALDNIISTKSMSSLALRGEYAYINPDPNTKKSTIDSDEGKSIAYVDDFEGTKKIIPIGIADRSWKDLSPPIEFSLTKINFTPSMLMPYKGKAFWYNISPSNVVVKDIWGDRKQVARDDQQVTVLDFKFDPSRIGSYNYEPDLSIPEENWGGMMKILSSTANNLLEENIEFIEFWANKIDGPDDMYIFIDLGLISEDIIPNNILDTEDKNRNDLEDQGEDTGIDGLFDFDEPGYNATTNPDPSQDNFYFDLGDGIYDGINLTEGNAEFRNNGIKLPDSEDLNRNFNLDRVNSFFRYKVKLDTNSITNEFITGVGENNWYQYRIPLKEFTEAINGPSLSTVEIIRFFVSGVNQPVHFKFAEMNLVGNQWRKVAISDDAADSDTVLVLSTINVEDNPFYTSPPGVQRERDRSQTEEEVYKNEQSLQLIINNMEDGDKREIFKDLPRALDVFDYKQMKLFIHGDLDESNGSVSYYNNETDYGAEVYFRFGTDSLNYYEYRQPVRAGWNEIDMIFSELTTIKQLRDSINILQKFPVPDRPDNSYGIRGNPTLTRVTYFTIGVENPDSIGEVGKKVSGEIWVNELRVLDAENTPGWAYSASATLKLADLLDVTFTTSQTDPYFHKLADRFGSRVDKKNWGVNFNFDFLKLIPTNLQGSNLRLNYSRQESISEPLYVPGTDILVEQAVKQTEEKLLNEDIDAESARLEANKIKEQSQTLSVNETWALTGIKFKLPSKAWYIEDIINSLTFGFNYNKKWSRNPTTSKNESWGWRANINYNLVFGKENFFYPSDIPGLGMLLGLFDDYRNVKIYFSPSNLNAALNADRSFSFNQTRTANVAPNISRDFKSARNFSFNWKLSEGGLFNISFDYSADFQSTLAYLLTIEKENNLLIDRSESDIWGDVFSGELFGKDYNFKQTFNFKTAPQLPSIWDINRYLTLSASYGVQYQWQNNLTQEELGRSAQFSSRLNSSLSLKLKQLLTPLFGEEEEDKGKSTPPNRGRGRMSGVNVDDEKDKKEEEVSDSTSSGKSILTRALNFTTGTIKYALVDYEQIQFNFGQQTTYRGGGISAKGTGFSNFWGIRQKNDNGPSRGFMLGLNTDLGPRNAGTILSDDYSQKNTIDFKTSRPLWEGANIDISWNVSWGVNKKTQFEVDELTNEIIVSNLTSTGSIDRSFLSLPPSLIFSFAGSGIKKVAELYDPESEDPTNNLSTAFVDGFESFPLLKNIPFLKDFTKYIPRPNWRINWSGLEKLSVFESWTDRVSLTHVYSSSYTEGWKIDPDGNQIIQTQRLNYGFSPLIGLNVTFKKLWDGNFNGSIKFSTKTSYDLGLSTRKITESLTKDISVTASYSKQGFSIPLFGISLKNDVEISLSYSSSTNSSILFEMDNFNEEGTPQDGTIRSSIEPRIKYIISSRVTLALFYKRTSIEPEGAARIPPTTTNEMGLDVHISIQ